MNESANGGVVLVTLIGLLCVYPFIFWALPAFLLGRFRVHLRAPVALVDRRSVDPAAATTRLNSTQGSVLRRIARDSAGYGSGGASEQ